MSALAAALASFNATPSQKIVLDGSAIEDSPPATARDHCITEPSSSRSSSLPSLSSSTCTSEASSSSAPPRTNEHLAVLLPKHLWKPDSLASQCDNFYCRVRFSVFERRHHCRKCGGIFCATCTARTTALLDTSKLDFIHPPRNTPLSEFASEKAPLRAHRVCGECWEQVHGVSSPRTPEMPSCSAPIAVILRGARSETSSLSSSVSTPPNGLPPMPRRALRHAASNSQLSLRRSRKLSCDAPDVTIVEPSYGELDTYPLRRNSAICKATGGGRWEPKPQPTHPGLRTPGGKAPYEVELDREDEELRARMSNPLVKDGEFQYRFLRNDPDPMPGTTPFQLATF